MKKVFPCFSKFPQKNRGSTSNRNQITNRLGISLLEVILSLGILGLSLPILGDVLVRGFQHAASTRELSSAHLHAERIYNELTAGIIPAVAASGTPINETVSGQDTIKWVYDLDISEADGGLEGLKAIVITVRTSPELSDDPYTYTLRGWITDPEIEFMPEEENADDSAGDGSSDDSSDNSSSDDTTGNTPAGPNTPIPDGTPGGIPPIPNTGNR